MQQSCPSLTSVERGCRFKSKLCPYCGEKRHFVLTCPNKRVDPPVYWEIQLSQTASPSHPLRPLLCGHLLLSGGSHELATLNDSGGNACIISGEVAHQLDLGQEPLFQSAPVLAIDSHRLGTILHQTNLWLCSYPGIIMSRSSSISWTSATPDPGVPVAPPTQLAH